MKKQKLSEFHRNNILDTAKQLFQQNGVSQTTMDDIAKKAEYSKSTIYVYFKSKDEIYNHIIFEHIKILKDSIETALENSPRFPDGYYAICSALMNFYNKYPLYFESILSEIRLPETKEDEILSSIYEVGEQINKIIEKYLESLIEKKLIFTDITNLTQVTFILWSSICGVISLANKKEPYINKAMNIPKETFMHDGFRMILNSLLNESR